MKVRGSVYSGSTNTLPNPALAEASISIVNAAGETIGSANPTSMGEWEIDVPGNPGTSGDVRLSYVGKSRDLFMGERQLGFGPSWDVNWPVPLAQVVSGTTTVRGGVSLDQERLAVQSSGGGLTVTVGSGSVVVPGVTFWVASFYQDTVLDFSSYNASTQAMEAYGTGEPAGGWVVGVERIPSTEQAFLTMARKESASSNALTTPNGTYTDPLASYDLNFIPIALVTRSGASVSSIMRVGRYLGEGRFHRRAREILTANQSSPVDITTSGEVVAGSDKTFVAGSNFTGRVMFRGDLLLRQVDDGTSWELQDTYGPLFNGVNMLNPGQVAVNSLGQILIADTGNDRLLILDSDGTYADSITSLTDITGVCVDSSDNIYTLSESASEMRLRKYNHDLVLQWGVTFGADGEQAHLTTNGTHVWYCNHVDRLVGKRLCSTGAAVSTFGSAGSTNGKFGSGGPYGITNDGTYLYVGDPGNFRVQKFLMSTSAYVAQWSTDEPPFGLAVDTSGNIVMADFNNELVIRTSNTGVFIDQFAQETAFGVVVASGDVVWVTNANDEDIAKWDQITVDYADWDKLLVLPDISINGSWQSLNFGDASNGALGYGAGWGTDVRPQFLPFRGVSSTSVTIAAGDVIDTRVTVKTSTGASRIASGQFSFQFVDMGSW